MPYKTLEPEQAKLKVLDSDDASQYGVLEGYASVFNNVDLGGDIVMPGAFAKTLKERLKKGMVKLYDSHLVHMGTKTIIGLVEEAKEDDYGLWFRARFSSVQDAQDVRTKVREGILNALSFGYEVVKDQFDEARKVNLLKELKLYEISVVPWGMNPKAAIEAVKGLVPLSAFELADEETAFSTSAALKRVRAYVSEKDPDDWGTKEFGVYARAFLWFDSENADDLGSYYLPIVDIIDGEPKYVLKGIEKALKLVRETEAAPWSSDQKKIEANLAKLFKRFGKDIPSKAEMDLMAGTKTSPFLAAASDYEKELTLMTLRAKLLAQAGAMRR